MHHRRVSAIGRSSKSSSRRAAGRPQVVQSLWRRMDQSRQLRMERLEDRLLLTGDLYVTRLTPLGPSGPPFDLLDIQFSNPVQSSSFTLSQLTISGPSGAITPSPTALTPIDRGYLRNGRDHRRHVHQPREEPGEYGPERLGLAGGLDGKGGGDGKPGVKTTGEGSREIAAASPGGQQPTAGRRLTQWRDHELTRNSKFTVRSHVNVKA